METIEPRYLEGNSIRELELEFGDLGRYVIDNDDQPNWPSGEGIFYGLFVFDDRFSGIEHLYDGFALPLQWKSGVQDDPALPEEVREQAESVRSLVEAWLNDNGDLRSIDTEKADPDDWGIQIPDRSIENLDLSNLSLPSDSLWAPMTAHLMLGILGGTPKHHVFSTGRWSGDGIAKVDGIAHKIEAVRRVGTSLEEQPILFVPESNESEAEKAAKNDIEIQTYSETDTDLWKCLKDHLRLLESPPRDNFEDMVKYANRQFLSKSERTDYYLDHLIEPLAEKFRERLYEIEALPESRECERLVITLGIHSELPVMLLHAYRPDEALIVCSERSRDECFDEVVEAIEQVGTLETTINECLLKGAHGKNTRNEKLVESLVEWLEQSPEPCRFVDVTPGTARMSAAVTLASQYASANLLYVEHDYHYGGPTFNSEQPDLLNWSTPT
jgi:hypothetical protein